MGHVILKRKVREYSIWIAAAMSPRTQATLRALQGMNLDRTPAVLQRMPAAARNSGPA